MRVLSLFDGISCGMVALERAGIKVDKYYASEIDDYSIKISRANYPNIIQLGDVTKLDQESLEKLGKIDLLIGGSPCQDLSSLRSGKGLNGKKSSLFYEYLRIRDVVKPKYFLLENVVPKNKDKEIITNLMGVEPIFINSSDFSAQTRQRLYWTNIDVQPIYNYCENVVQDILEHDAEWTDVFPGWLTNKWGDKTRLDMLKTIHEKSHCITASIHKGQIMTYVKNDDGFIHKLSPLECERLQTLPDNYTNHVSNTHRYSAIGNGWTVDVIVHILKGIKECK